MAARNWVQEMESKRAARERIRLQELQEREERAKKEMEMSDSMVRAAKLKESAKHAPKTSVTTERFKIVEEALPQGSSDADAWWNSTLRKKKQMDDLLWTPDMGNPREEDRKIVDAYARKPVRNGYRGFLDSKEPEYGDKSFEMIMEEYKDHARLEEGRTREATTSGKGRPNASESPMEALRWIETLRTLPDRLRGHNANERAQSTFLLADMSEETTEAEAQELVEHGILAAIMALDSDAKNDLDPKSVYCYLQASKTGSDTKMARYLFLVHICLARILRNLSCVLSANFRLHPRSGNPSLGCIPYDWLSSESAVLVDIIVQYPGIYTLLLQLFSHECSECTLHAVYTMMHLSKFNDRNKLLILETQDLLPRLLEHLQGSSEEIRQAVIQLFASLLNSRSRELLYNLKGTQGQTFMSCISLALREGSEKTKEISAWIIWKLIADKGSMNALQRHPHRSEKKVQNGRRASLGLADAVAWLGDGIVQDAVKQAVCREPGILDGLSNLINNGVPPSQEAASAAVWCLAIERTNKRKIGLHEGILSGLCAMIKSSETSEYGKRYARSAVRNLGTDPVSLSYVSSKDKDFVPQLIKNCEMSQWQVQLSLSNLCHI